MATVAAMGMSGTWSFQTNRRIFNFKIFKIITNRSKIGKVNSETIIFKNLMESRIRKYIYWLRLPRNSNTDILYRLCPSVYNIWRQYSRKRVPKYITLYWTRKRLRNSTVVQKQWWLRNNKKVEKKLLPGCIKKSKIQQKYINHRQIWFSIVIKFTENIRKLYWITGSILFLLLVLLLLLLISYLWKVEKIVRW